MAGVWQDVHARRRAAAVLIAVFFALVATLISPVAGMAAGGLAPGASIRLSSGDGEPYGFGSLLSRDGSTVAHASWESAITPRLFLYDVATGARTEVPGEALGGAISGDGRYVAYGTPIATNSDPDLYLYDRDAGQSRLLNVAVFGQYAISDDGSTVAYVKRDTAAGEVLFVTDVATGVTMVVPTGDDGWVSRLAGQEVVKLTWPRLSADGQKIAYVAIDGTAVDAPRELRVFDRATAQTVTIASGASELRAPSMSPDGDLVAYSSGSLRVHNLLTRATQTIRATGEPAGFVLANTSLVVVDHGLFLRDLATGAERRLDLTVDAEPADGNLVFAAVDETASLAVFSSTASNLVPEEPGLDWDVFLRDLTPIVSVVVDVRASGGSQRAATVTAYSASGFDAATIDPSEACLETACGAIRDRMRVTDVDKDGDTDVTLQFDTRALAFAEGDRVCLRGVTAAGVRFAGCALYSA